MLVSTIDQMIINIFYIIINLNTGATVLKVGLEKFGSSPSTSSVNKIGVAASTGPSQPSQASPEVEIIIVTLSL